MTPKYTRPFPWMPELTPAEVEAYRALAELARQWQARALLRKIRAEGWCV